MLFCVTTYYFLYNRRSYFEDIILIIKYPFMFKFQLLPNVLNKTIANEVLKFSQKDDFSL